MRRFRAIAAILLALGLGLGASSAVLAKGGDVIATFDAPLPVDSAAGSTVRIAWTLTMTFPDGTVHPYLAEGIYLRLSPATGGPIEVPAQSDRDGHFVAKVTVPSGGLGKVEIGLKGLACTAADSCTRADEIFRIAAKPASAGVAPGAAAVPAATPPSGAAAVQPAPVAPAAATDAASVSPTTGLPDVTPAILVVLAGIVLLGTAVALRGRRRQAAA
jgi:hypothetical protein